MESGMSDGWSSGLVVPLTLAGPCPFLLMPMSYCPGRVYFFEVRRPFPYYLLSPLITPLLIAARVIWVFYVFFFFVLSSIPC